MKSKVSSGIDIELDKLSKEPSDIPALKKRKRRRRCSQDESQVSKRRGKDSVLRVWDGRAWEET